MSEMDASELEDIDLNETDVSASTNGQGGGPLLETPDSNEEPMPRLLSGSNDGSDDGTDPEMPDGSDDDAGRARAMRLHHSFFDFPNTSSGGAPHQVTSLTCKVYPV